VEQKILVLFIREYMKEKGAVKRPVIIAQVPSPYDINMTDYLTAGTSLFILL